MSKLTEKQRNLISYNYSMASTNASLTYAQERAMLDMAYGDNADADNSDLVGLVWNIWNKRDHEWLPNEKDKSIQSLKELITKYMIRKGQI